MSFRNSTFYIKKSNYGKQDSKKISTLAYTCQFLSCCVPVRNVCLLGSCLNIKPCQDDAEIAGALV